MPKAIAQVDYAFSGVRMHCILTGEETNGSFCLFENSSLGNSGSPVHLHKAEDETIFVHEGEMEAIIDGESHILSSGQAVFMPRGVPHQLRNPSASPSRYGILCTPSGFEDFVAEAGHVMKNGEQPQPPSPAEIASMREAAPRFGIHLLLGFSPR